MQKLLQARYQGTTTLQTQYQNHKIKTERTQRKFNEKIMEGRSAGKWSLEYRAWNTMVLRTRWVSQIAQTNMRKFKFYPGVGLDFSEKKSLIRDMSFNNIFSSTEGGVLQMA
jgi:hypothetical protein